ncbi:hypothetical protein ACNFBT_12295 [Pseudomonas sp. NY15181]|uniref:hypothetical protein n=1 Tax=Pseudomonas sp. NY15181 TaxID=3400349 RepID=UPI003A84A615
MSQHIELTLLALADRVACFHLQDELWHCLQLDGEPWNSLADQSQSGLAGILTAISKQLYRQSQLADVQLNILYDQDALPHLTAVPSTLAALGCRAWQILRWEPLFSRLPAQDRASTDGLPEHVWLRAYALPYLYDLFQQPQDTLSDELNLQRQRAATELQRLQEQIDARQLPSVEHLLVYLPMLYQNFWGHVSPTEVAALAGSLQVPDVPSPFPEPSIEILMILRKRFLLLPATERSWIIRLGQQLGQRLKLRVQMRDLVEATE